MSRPFSQLDRSTAFNEAVLVKLLHLFPDTNLFIQCLELEALDWSVLDEFDEINLRVSRPVQREIDRQKGKGNDRVGRRARETHSIFRDIIVGEQGYKLVRESGPRVLLLVEPSYLPSPTLKDCLNYSEADDQIIGCIHTYMEEHPNADARLLTHDSGPMASAKMLSMPFVPIPDNWLRPPEIDEAGRLRKKLERLKDNEPRFTINTHVDSGAETDSFQFEWPIYENLSEDVLTELMESLKARFPLAKEFGPSEPMERSSQDLASVFFQAKEIFTPATETEIAEYINTSYPEWITRCEKILRQIHAILQNGTDPIIFSFSSVNEGTRPGKDVIVTITAKGNFLIRPPQVESESESDSENHDSEQLLSLPSPPTSPRGVWASNNGMGSLKNLNRILGNLNLIGEPLPTALNLLHDPILYDPISLRRDPNGFYYKPKHSDVPVESFSLECEQWRHGIEAEIFECEICVDGNTQEVRGALECLIHAENLSNPVKKIIPVRGNPKLISARLYAENLLEKLFRSDAK